MFIIKQKLKKAKELFGGLCGKTKDFLLGVCDKIKKLYVNLREKTKKFFGTVGCKIKKIPGRAKCICNNGKTKCKSGVLKVKKSIFRNKKLYSFFYKIKEFFIFVDENRKIAYPVLILIYTVVIVAITIAAEKAYFEGNYVISSERKIVEEMENPAHQTLLVLMENTPCVVSEECTIEYKGSAFERKINPSKAEQFGSSYYENHLESNVYMDVIIAYTNTSSETIRGSEAVKMVARCDSTEYRCFTAIETDNGKNIEFANNVDIAPDSTALVHCIFDVPRDTDKNCQNIIAELVANNKSYIIDVK